MKDEKIVVTPETPLDPAPKRVEGKEVGETVEQNLGTVSGTLHKPPLKIVTKDEGQSVEEIAMQIAKEITNRLGVASAKKIILPNASALIGPDGVPLIAGGKDAKEVNFIEKIGEDDDEIEFTAEEMAMLRNKDELTIIKIHDLGDSYDYWCFPIMKADDDYVYVGSTFIYPTSGAAYIRTCTLSFESEDSNTALIEIQDITIPSANSKVNLITLGADEDITDVIDNLSVGDIVKVNGGGVYIVSLRTAGNFTAIYITDDSSEPLYFYSYSRIDNEWVVGDTAVLATQNYVDGEISAEKGTKLYRHDVVVDPNGPNYLTITIVSASSTPFTTINPIMSNFTSFLKMTIDDDEGLYEEVIGVNLGEELITKTNTYYTIEPGNEWVIISDTVTEL